MKLSERQLQDLSRFARLPEGNVLTTLLLQRLAEYDRDTRLAPMDQVQVCQGKARAIQALLDDINQAGARLQQSKSSAPRAVIPLQAHESAAF